MNIKEYIASGIVELYAINALSPEEKKEFEKLGLMYPEIVEELRLVEKNLENYASSYSMNPRPRLREIIVNQLPVEAQRKDTGKEKKPTDSDHSLTYKYLIAASLAALVISTFASWFFYSRWNDAEERYSASLREKNDLTINYNVVKATYDETLANLLIVRDESSQCITLVSADTVFKDQVRIYWNPHSAQTYLDVLSLKEVNDSLQYQLWANAKGTFIDAGIVSQENQHIQRMKDVSGADFWMVTLEPKGGSPAPDMLRIQLETKKN